MKIILTCRITQYFNDCIIADDGDLTFNLDKEYEIVDVDMDILNDYMRGYERKLDFKIEADVELNQLSYTAYKTIIKGTVSTLYVENINIYMKDDAFTNCYISYGNITKDNEIIYELDPDDNEDLKNELEVIETRGAA